MDPGPVRRRGRGADGQPRSARRGLRRGQGQGAATSARSTPRVVDAREEFASEYVLPAIKANAIYGLGYPLFTALGRPLIAKLAVEYARQTGCDTIAHGCTGKGNDQVRIEATIATLAPGAEGDRAGAQWRMGRDEEVAYAREHGIPVKGGTEIRAVLDRRQPVGPLERGPVDRGARPRARATTSSSSSRRPEEAPDEPETVTDRVRARACRSALNGERLGLVELLERAAEIGARHGVGIVDHIEDRIVGLKVRDIYEVPAAAILLPAHAELERLVGTIHQNQFKPALDQKWAYLVYAGLWWEPLRADLDAYMDAVNAQVTGTIGIKLYKGSARVVTRASPNAVYDAQLATFSRIRRPVLAGRLAGIHRAVVAAVADGVEAQAPDAGSIRAWVTRFSATSSGRAGSGTPAGGCAPCSASSSSRVARRWWRRPASPCSARGARRTSGRAPAPDSVRAGA